MHGMRSAMTVAMLAADALWRGVVVRYWCLDLHLLLGSESGLSLLHQVAAGANYYDCSVSPLP